MGTTNAQVMNDEKYINRNTIEAFFNESVILITGATGFLGKALLEKLLRSCPQLATIFILIRPKPDQTIEQRHKKLLENKIFNQIRTTNPTALDKVYPVKGDVSLSGLGLSPEDRDMLKQRVNIVFHSAATVKFDEPLKVAVNLNTKGTDRVIELCAEMNNLISVIHVSTAYSNANRLDIRESIYTTKVKPSTVIDMCESLDEETLNAIEKNILENHPNTYTFTKNLAEQIVVAKAKHLPIAIVRPSVVCAAEKEPFPGWVDNVTGLSGIVMEIGRGVIRTFFGDKNKRLDAIPVDYVVDTIICAAWHSTMQRSNTIKIYNCTSNAKPLSFQDANNLIKKYALQSPSKHIMWYPGCTITNSTFTNTFMSIILHTLPAFFGDLFSRLLGNKPIMLKSVKRVGRLLKVVHFFSAHEWNFHRDNMNDLSKKVKAMKDHDNFNVDIQHLEWDSYFQHYMLGIKEYILKENPEATSEARNRLFVLYWVHRLTQVSSIIILLTMILRIGH